MTQSYATTINLFLCPKYSNQKTINVQVSEEIQKYTNNKPILFSYVEFATLYTALATQCSPLQVILQKLYQKEL